MNSQAVKSGWFGALFLVGIGVPFVGYLYNLATFRKPSAAMQEKPKPELGLQSWAISRVAKVRTTLGGASSSNRVLLGHHGWLFLGDPEVVRQIEGLDRLSPDDLKRWTDALKQDQTKLNAAGIKFLVALAPEKSSVYWDELPDYIHLAWPVAGTKIDQFVDACDQEGIPLVDLRQALSQARMQEIRTYQKLDTHWNDTGASLGAQAIREALGKQGLNLRIPDLKMETRAETGGDLARFLGLRDSLQESQRFIVAIDGKPADLRPHQEEFFYPEQQIDTGQPGLPKLMLFRDSFGTRLAPILARSFSHTTVLWPNDPKIDVDRAIHDHPDVVILEFVERKLH